VGSILVYASDPLLTPLSHRRRDVLEDVDAPTATTISPTNDTLDVERITKQIDDRGRDSAAAHNRHARTAD
jgi:hypothetical protein